MAQVNSTWLPQPEGFRAYAVDRQEGVPGSTLELYRHLLRLRAFMQVGSRQQHPGHARRPGPGHHLIAIAGKLRTGQIYADIKHHRSHMATALAGG